MSGPRIAAIIGGGVIGGGWAARFALNGWDVRVFDPAPDARESISAVMAEARRALPMLYDSALPREGTMTFCDSVTEAVAGAAWVQESVPERLDLKHRILAEIQQTLDPEAVIGSSTSGFTPTQLREGSVDPTQIVVTHPFNPVYLLPLVEVVPGPDPDPRAVDWAKAVLRGIGMHPLIVRKEIDAHIADRFLEAVWREALWLVKDGVATTEEIDDAIRYGFGLRWAQMGLFETYRLAGGAAGMRHFIAQFGPALAWPWTKLMDVPELTDELIETIAAQSDTQSGAVDIPTLARRRDDNLVAILRALKGRDSGAGALLNAHERARSALPEPMGAALIETIRRTIPVDWTDYNDHMNESRYGQVFSDAADAIMRIIGADAEYIASGLSYFTVEIDIRFLAETCAGEPVVVRSRVLEGRGKKLRLFHEMRRDSDDTLLATGEQMLIHVSLETRRSCDPTDAVRGKVEALAESHANLPPLE